MLVTNCYIKGTIVEKLGDSSDWHQSEEASIGDTVEYPSSHCSRRLGDLKVLISSFDEYGRSAIVLDNIEVIYKQEELPIYEHWKQHFDVKELES